MLVVLDVKLPDMDGTAVCSVVKENPETAGTMILQVSAYYTSTEHQAYGLDCGADAYIPGDIAPALLVAAVRALLRTSKAEEAVRQRERQLGLLQALDRSQAELRAVTASLLTAQDDERRLLARDLHDDVLQRLAVLELGLGKLRVSQSESVIREINALSSQLAGVSRDLRHLSHGLHPTVLEDLGLESALKNLCEEFEHSYTIAIRCVCSQMEHPVPSTIATTMFRIAQEALRNVVKHAGDARVTVTVGEIDNNWVLTIRDDGCGFDPIAERPRPTLGLISIQERAKLVRGQVNIVSAKGEGTTITVKIPFS